MHETLWGSANALRAMIHASPLAMVAIGGDEKVTIWNPAAQHIFGWSEEEVLGQRPPYVPEDKQAEFRVLHEQRMRGESVSGLELRRQRKDGTLIDVSLWTAPLQDAAGRIVGILGLLDDITERTRAQEGLIKRTQQLEAVRVVNAEITRELDLTALLALIHRRAMELVGADGGSLFLWDETAQRLVPQVWHGIPDAVGSLALQAGEGVCGVVVERGEGMIVNDYWASPTRIPDFWTRRRSPLSWPSRCVSAIGWSASSW
jgi:PAS domain S-box-containing protein